MKKLLDMEDKLAGVQTQTHLTHSFVVSEHCRKLHIDFSYSPKSLDDETLSREIIGESLRKYTDAGDNAYGGQAFEESWKRFLPLKNLITVSVDDPNGFRGACHRQDPKQQLFLAADSASPGLMPGPIIQGTWSVTLSVHALVTEKCDVSLVVWEGDDAE